MTVPNFFIIGAQKAGTTSLYNYVNRHPQVYMSPVKEPFFFDHEMTLDGEILGEEFGGPVRQPPPRFSNLDEYRALFDEARDEIAIGEASPLYIYAPGTAERLQRHAPGAKFIALLRNPAERAYSSFLHAVRIGAEPLDDFARALREEEDRIRHNWHYVYHYRSRGLYYGQLEPYYRLFGPERMGVWLYEDLRDDPAGVTRSVFRFLGVDDEFTSDTYSKHNPAGVPNSRSTRTMARALGATATVFRRTLTPTSRLYPIASRIRQRVQGRILAKPPPVDQQVHNELIENYTEDIVKLQELVGRDLSVWLENGKKR